MHGAEPEQYAETGAGPYPAAVAEGGPAEDGALPEDDRAAAAAMERGEDAAAEGTAGEPGEDAAEDSAADTAGDTAEDSVLDGPRPLGVGTEPTGHPPVDAQLRRLEDADHLAVSGHLEVYEDVHRGLRDTLTALDRHDDRPDPRS
ncbi:hypothetical protein DVA86_27655 [Streptomyces armeniacus]|uniref:Uncharacterized protein n=2 Tax=Streptomyces armeniacus TaxID=83291 RepID=A0A345Y1D7_9ACTN|nr:hypothetical protein DVA86_27655 [Streptomyces armeniacus]